MFFFSPRRSGSSAPRPNKGVGKQKVMELSKEERKMLLLEKFERVKQQFSLARSRMEKTMEMGSTDKMWYVETIREIAFKDIEFFNKVPPISYSVDDSLEKQLDLPMTLKYFTYKLLVKENEVSIEDFNER